ncbi:hypothetical protein KOI35_18060 [Actinoplanes bogorensis]|uniref:Uncharacterized protein n=1 Tax=Paractinoplanes bogorensis TaxID=1610840 RepID=A0ABS5YTN2_9ACTN|nr:hypothetical protein [Actinoplanes bogorensis]MBU2665415.1 hypothetical protein [Actinoplanes bogorensis]
MNDEIEPTGDEEGESSGDGIEPTADNEIELISDGDGMAVFGNAAAVDRFLTAENLPSKDLGMQRITSALKTGSTVAKAASEISKHSGRWVMLSADSARKMQHHGLMKGSASHLSRAVLTTRKGEISGLLEIVRTGKTVATLSNPAALAAAAAAMAQQSMQQKMDEITDYLAVIDQKVDDVLRGQKDAVLADTVGADVVIGEALTVRDRVGRVSEVTWSKVQATSFTVTRTLAYALRQLDALAEKVERQDDIAEMAKAAQETERKVPEWLAVLARSVQMQDAIALLELDRVLDSSPDELDRHRLGLSAARENRMDLIAQATDRLLARMDTAARTANKRVLLNPVSSPAVVRSSNRVMAGVLDFRDWLGIENSQETRKVRRWLDAAGDGVNAALNTGRGALDATVHHGGRALTATAQHSGRALEVAADQGKGALDATAGALDVAAQHGKAALDATAGALDVAAQHGKDAADAAAQAGKSALGAAKSVVGKLPGFRRGK